jgi:alanine dehydrogenase
MPGSVPRTSSHALNNATLPYGLALADDGLKALLRDEGFLKGLNTHGGSLTNAPVAQSQGLAFCGPREVLA